MYVIEAVSDIPMGTVAFDQSPTLLGHSVLAREVSIGMFEESSYCVHERFTLLELRNKTLFDDTIQPLHSSIALRIIQCAAPVNFCRNISNSYDTKCGPLSLCRTSGIPQSRKQFFQDLNYGGRRHRVGCSYLLLCRCRI